MEKHVLQWHITHKCNLRCLHCYQEDYKSDLNFEEIKKVFLDYLDYIEEHNFRGHINITGGEPFLHPDFFKVISMFEENNITFGILTNGTLLNEEMVKKLKQFKKLSFVQISLDGTRKMHDEIRGKGNFKKALNGIRLLNKYDIQSMVAFTAHKKNIHKLKSVIRLVKREKVKVFWADRLIPTGTYEDVLNTEEFLKMASLLQKESVKAKKKSVTDIRVNRALMFLGGSDTIYHCSAGINLLTILANGDLLPCRRMPIVIGNTLDKSITEMCEESSVIKTLKDNEIPKECKRCYKADKCRGGLKCLSYAVTGKIGVKDINCPIIKSEN
ncbi:MAG: radical SAM protein [Clostridium sp.]|nr:radical SAM protein [Clostridium sp.]